MNGSNNIPGDGVPFCGGGGAAAVPAGVIAWSDGRWLTAAFAAVLVAALLSAGAAVRVAVRA